MTLRLGDHVDDARYCKHFLDLDVFIGSELMLLFWCSSAFAVQCAEHSLGNGLVL